MGLGITTVGISEISPYKKSEQPRIARKHLTRHAKNGYSVVAVYCIATLRSRASLFLEGRRPRSLDPHLYGQLSYFFFIRHNFNRA